MKVLIIGLGSIAGKHVEALKKINAGVEFFALRARMAASLPGVKDIYKISDIPSDISFIVISNPTSMHADAIEKILHLKKPLFIEKPFASSLPDAERVSRIIAKEQILAYLAYPLRFHPVLQELKRLLEKETSAIQEVSIYNGSYLPGWRKNVDYRTSYSADSELGGGVHLDMSHEIDLAYWLFGKPDTAKALLRKRSLLDIKSYDFANYRLYYSGFLLSVTLNYYRKMARRTIEVVFEDKIILADILAGSIKVNDKISYKFIGNMEEMYEHQLRYFMQAVAAGVVPMNNLDEALQVMNLIFCEHETEG